MHFQLEQNKKTFLYTVHTMKSTAHGIMKLSRELCVGDVSAIITFPKRIGVSDATKTADGSDRNSTCCF